MTFSQAPDGSVAVEEPQPSAARPVSLGYLPLMEQVGALVGGVLVAWELYERVARRLTRSRH